MTIERLKMFALKNLAMVFVVAASVTCAIADEGEDLMELENGVLEVCGTENDDLIRLKPHPTFKNYILVEILDGNENEIASQHFYVPQITTVFVFGLAGNDRISDTTNLACIYDGGPGDDRIYGGKGNNTLYGGEGDDFLHDNLGKNFFAGGFGNDTMIGGNAGNWFFGDYMRVYDQEADFAIENSGRNDLIYGGTGNDLIYGNEGSDIIYGGHGNDIIHGDGGFVDNEHPVLFTYDDWIFGGPGNDEIWGWRGSNFIFGGIGNDKIYADVHPNQLGAQLIVVDEEPDNWVFGDGGNDLIYGSLADDAIFGGDGNVVFSD